MRGVEGDLMSQESIDEPKQFMGDDENGLLVPFPLGSFFQVHLLEDWIDSDDRDSHQDQNTPEA